MSYFAKPNFIVYDEWFDNNFEKTTTDDKNKKITKISNTHQFFYEQSNYKVGGSEINLQVDINLNKEEPFNNYYFENNSEKYASLSNKKFLFFKKPTKNKLKFRMTKQIIYPLSIFSFLFILGFQMFFISQSEESESKIINKSIKFEKGF